MSLSTAQAFAWSLASTLMVCVTLYRAGDGFAALPSAEFDGDPDTVLCEYDPHS